MLSDTVKPCAGFTLIEMIVTLVIVGFIGIGGTYSLMYGVSLYRSIQSIETILPQIDVAMNVIVQKIREKNENDIYFSTTSKLLRLDGQKGYVLLRNVQDFSVTKDEIYGNLSKVTLVMLPGAAGAKEKTFVFYVSSNKGE